MKILIGADFVPTKSNFSQFESGDVKELFGSKLCDKIKSSDYRIFNLEIPLTDEEHPIPKCGPNLIAPTECVAGYKAAGVDLLTLANNHILDQDQQGLESTIQVLNRAGIDYTGVGSTPDEAAKPYIFTCNGKNIGVYACAEHEFSIVTEHSAGANPIDLLESPDHVAKLKEQCDYVIVLYHGGKEHYRYPSPNLQKVCRKLVEKGADLVVCQHSHCIGCEEKYQGGTIVYGQGNFLFDDDDSEFWKTSLLISIGDAFKIDYIPLVKNENTVRMAEEDTANTILSDFKLRSRQIQERKFIEEEYAHFSHEMLNRHLMTFLRKGNGFAFRVANKFTHGKWAKEFAKRLPKAYKLALINYIQCEAHRELLIMGLDENCGVK